MARLPNRRTVMIQALDQAISPVYLLNSDRQIVFCNPACLKWLETSDDQLLGQQVDYGASPVDHPLPWGGLCPSPEHLSGEPSECTVWASPDRVAIARHQASVIPLSASSEAFTSSEASADVLVIVGAQFTDDGSEADAGPTKDCERLHQQLLRYTAHAPSSFRIDPLIGVSPMIRQVRAQVELACQHADRVVIVGPVGSGHEQVARAIHRQSERKGRSRLLPLECSLLDCDVLQTTIEAFIRRSVDSTKPKPETDITSKFDTDTDTDTEMPTLLLLDVDQLELDAQQTLLDLLGRDTLNLRTLATAATDLVQRDGFRADLSAALGTLTIRLPALIERLEDLPLLAQAVVQRTNDQAAHQLAGLTSETLDRLLNHPWRGNLDEFVDALRQARDHCQTPTIHTSDLPSRIQLSAEAERFPVKRAECIELDNYLATIERELIQRALRAAADNRTQAARLLGVSRARLLRRLTALDLDTRGSAEK